MDDVCAEHIKHNMYGNISFPFHDCHQCPVKGVLCYYPDLSSENAVSPTLKKKQERNNLPLYNKILLSSFFP